MNAMHKIEIYTNARVVEFDAAEAELGKHLKRRAKIINGTLIVPATVFADELSAKAGSHIEV